jgi:hypothetical protein
MSEEKPSENSIADEFRNLGENLINSVRNAWESEERKKLQQEVEEGLNQLAATLKMEVETFKESPAGQRIRSDVADLRERVRTGEAESKLREEILKALRMINAELEKISDTGARQEQQSSTPAEQPTAEDKPAA